MLEFYPCYSHTHYPLSVLRRHYYKFASGQYALEGVVGPERLKADLPLFDWLINCVILNHFEAIISLFCTVHYLFNNHCVER